MRKMVLFLTFFILAAAATILIGAAEARTIIVDDDWSGADYDNIGAAIAAAKNGDTVRVYDGTYNEDNTVNKAINLVGNGTTTIIDGHKKDHTFGFNLIGGGCNVSGFYFYYWWPTHHYGGIGVYSDDNVIYDNTFFYNNRGIFLENCRDNVMFNNTFDKNFYSILVYQRADYCTISFNTFSRDYSSAIHYSQSVGSSIFSNTFENYTTRGISIGRSSDFTVSFNMFHVFDTTSGNRFGLSVYKVVDTEVHNNTFIGHGRALYVWGTTNLRIEHNTILGGDEGLYFGRTFSGRYQLGPWCNGTIVRNNNILGQSRLGANATYGQVTSIDARNNWWADATGPYHQQDNTAGLGVVVTDLVTFDPWLAKMVMDMPPLAIINHVAPYFTNEGEPIEFMGRGLARNRTAEHVWTSSIDGVIYTGTDVVFTLSDLSPGTHTITLKVTDEFGKWSEEVSTTLVINGVPQVFIDSIAPVVVNEGGDVTFKGHYVDHENDIRYIAWGSDLDGIIGREMEFVRSDLSNGTHMITLIVEDGYKVRSNKAIGEVMVNGIPRAIIEAIEPGHVNDSEPVIFRGGFIDAENSVDGFHWESNIDGVLSDQARYHSSSLTNGTHTITFRVMDDFGVWSENVTATLVVNGIPKAIIVSITPGTATKGDTVTFNGGFLDHENNILVYEWVSDIDGLLNTRKDFTTTELSLGTHMISFRVMDHAKVWSQWAVSTVHVNGRPSGWIVPSEPVLVNEGETLRLTGGFKDPEGDVRGYEWISDIDGTVGTAWNLTTSQLSNGTHSISFRVIDGQGAWSKAVAVTVTVNGIPRAIIFRIDPSSAQEGEAVIFRGAYHDHEDDVYGVQWVSDMDGPLSSKSEFTTSGLSNGTHTITFRVMDGHGVTSELAFGSVSVNGRPRAEITNVGPVGVMEGATVHFAGKADDDVAVLAYRWSSSIDGQLSELPVFSKGDLSPGTHTISFIAQDEEGTWSDASTLTFVVEGFDIRAEVTHIDLPSLAFEGEVVTVGCIVGNPGNVPLLDMTVRFSFDGQAIGEVEVAGPLHPGSDITVDVPWTVEVGRHVVLVEVVRGGVVVSSALSGGAIDVGPVPVLEDIPAETPMSDRTDELDGGADGRDTVIFLVAFAAVVATAYMLWSLKRPSRWED